MKSAIIPALILVAALSSCTTAYKTGQTPDDVYYSSARPQTEEDKTEKEERRDYSYSDDYYDDRYLRMKIRNRYQWNDLNDWYSYDRYSFGYNYAWGTYYNPYNSWNYYYNPYCCCHGNHAYNSPKLAYINPAVVRPHNFNLGGYTNTNYNNTNNNNGKTAVRNSGSRPVYNNSNNNNSGRGLSNTVRTIFSGNENNNNSGSSGSSGSSSSRTYTPSSSSSSSSSSGSSSSGSSSGGSSSGGSVSRPGRN